MLTCWFVLFGDPDSDRPTGLSFAKAEPWPASQNKRQASNANSKSAQTQTFIIFLHSGV